MTTTTNFLIKGKTKFILSLIFTFITLALFTQPSYTQSWNAFGSGTSSTVYAMTVFNGELIVAGDFLTAGGTTVNRIARWNGTTWAALGTGTGTNGPVYALAVFGGQLYVGGNFTTAGGIPANRIARWSGSAWTALGLGANNTVFALSVFNSALRVGGSFTTTGGLSASRIAGYDGTNWIPMGSGVNNDVYALTTFGADLIIGGSFTIAGAITVNRICRYTPGGTYIAMGTGVDNGSVLALAVYASLLRVGGSFTTIASNPVNYIASWNGSNWSNIGTGMNNTVNALSAFGTDLVAGGLFTNASGTPANYIARYNGTTWSSYGTGMSGGLTSVNAISSWAAILIAGGVFTSAGGTAANNVAAWGSVPTRPTLISPTDGATNQSLNLTLDWSDVTGAFGYGLQIATNTGFTNIVLNIQVAASQYTVPAGILSYYTTYFWRANAYNGLGTGLWSDIWYFRTLILGVEINKNEIPERFNLYQNYPNPFNPTTKIKFDIPSSSSASTSTIKLAVYDVTGREVKMLFDGEYKPGVYEVTVDASRFTSGVYFYKLTAGQYTATNKMMIVK